MDGEGGGGKGPQARIRSRCPALLSLLKISICSLRSVESLFLFSRVWTDVNYTVLSPSLVAEGNIPCPNDHTFLNTFTHAFPTLFQTFLTCFLPRVLARVFTSALFLVQLAFPPPRHPLQTPSLQPPTTSTSSAPLTPFSSCRLGALHPF
jgi:hypothetical protein